MNILRPACFRSLALLVSLLAAPACSVDSGAAPTTLPSPDLGPSGPDLACEPGGCVAEANEDCYGCMHHIGECCYKDQNLGTTPASVNGLALACLDIPRCAACCNECKALSCDEIIRRGNCPFTQ